jgi:hypothetical protein
LSVNDAKGGARFCRKWKPEVDQMRNAARAERILKTIRLSTHEQLRNKQQMPRGGRREAFEMNPIERRGSRIKAELGVRQT